MFFGRFAVQFIDNTSISQNLSIFWVGVSCCTYTIAYLKLDYPTLSSQWRQNWLDRCRVSLRWTAGSCMVERSTCCTSRTFRIVAVWVPCRYVSVSTDGDIEITDDVTSNKHAASPVTWPVTTTSGSWQAHCGDSCHQLSVSKALVISCPLVLRVLGFRAHAVLNEQTWAEYYSWMVHP